MSGIYIHIPFCKQACYYCNFHFSTSLALALRDEMISAICKEITLQKNYFHDEFIHTIYFGGGTPSLLTERELNQIIEAIFLHFKIDEEALEFTLEANPDDLNKSKLQIFKNLGINRLSIGVQSFHDAHLKYLHRIHTSIQAKNAIKIAKDLGVTNLSIDLIYGIPAESHQIWKMDLENAIALAIPHISTYCLTIESHTVFGKRLKYGKLKLADENFSVEQMKMTIEKLQANSYQHYEIANFACNNAYAKHNTAYWKQVSYLGLGPSAHSYDGKTRQHNVADNDLYIKAIRSGKIPAKKEILSNENCINEYIMTSLRTMWGCQNNFLITNYNYNLLTNQQDAIMQYCSYDFLLLKKDTIYLTLKGKFIADKIIEDLMIIC